MFTVQPAVLPLGLTSVTATVVQLDTTMTLPILYARVSDKQLQSVGNLLHYSL